MGDLESLTSNFKEFIFREGIRTLKLVDPNVDLRGMEKEEDVATNARGFVKKIR
jgi:hypothetical protein